MRSQQQQSAEIDAENMQHFVVRRPSPRVRTANATQTSTSLRIASSSPSLDVDQLDKCSSLGGHRGNPQLVGRAVTPLRHHQTNSGPVMGSSRQCRWLALALRGDGETQLELMHCGEPRFSAAALLGTALLVRSDAPKRKELESFIYQLPAPCLWLRSNLKSRIRHSNICQSLSCSPLQGNTTLPMLETHRTFFESTRPCATYTTLSFPALPPSRGTVALNEILTRHSGSRIN